MSKHIRYSCLKQVHRPLTGALKTKFVHACTVNTNEIRIRRCVFVCINVSICTCMYMVTGVHTLECTYIVHIHVALPVNLIYIYNHHVHIHNTKEPSEKFTQHIYIYIYIYIRMLSYFLWMCTTQAMILVLNQKRFSLLQKSTLR